MHLTNLSIKNFRNIPKAEFEFSPNLNVFIAPNGTGKTNILEAISLVSSGKSSRTNVDRELLPLEMQLVSDSKSFTKLSAQVDSENDPKEIIWNLKDVTGNPELEDHFPQVKKTYRYKGKNTTRKKFSSLMPSVYFSPESIGHLTQGQTKIRDLFDSLLESTDYEYADDLSNYKKALRNRNILLKKLQTTGSSDELNYWSQVIIANGVRLTINRWKALAKYSELLSTISPELLKEKWLTLEYLPHVDSTPLDEADEIKTQFLDDLNRLKDQEVYAGKTLKGPHRDKWVLKLDDKDLAKYGSRGQQRVGVLALFLSFFDQISEHEEVTPLLLLDDVTSELDEKHIALLKNRISDDKSQTFLTTTQHDIAEKFKREVDEIKIFKLEESF